MKRLAVLTISLLTAISAFGGTAAYAAEESGVTNYPGDEDFIKTLTFSSLSDYAVNGGTYAFADGKTIFVCDGGNRSEYPQNKKITRLDCFEGVFYYQNEDGETYSLPDNKTAVYEMPETETVINLGSYTYMLTGTTLKVADFNSEEIVTFDGEYYSLKQYESTVYAISNNELYSFNEVKKTKISLKYDDITVTQKIKVGQAAAALVDYSLGFVTVKEGAHMTEIDLSKPLEEYFALKYPEEDRIADNTVRAEEDKLALLLCYTGNAAVVAIGDSSYILLKANTQEASVNCYAEKEFENATIIGNRIYASPYVIIGTSAIENAAGTIVRIENKIELDGVLGSVFYEVADLDGKKLGYVAEGFLTKYIIEDNKEPAVIPDPSHSEKSDTTTIILVLMVIVLVLIALGYLTYVSTRSKNKKGSSEEEPKEKQDKKKNKKKAKK